MIALWLPLWSLIGPDEGFIFLIIVFTFFVTISIAVKSRSNMSCTVYNRNNVAQEYMALTKNPFQFRLSPPRPNADEIQLQEDAIDRTDDIDKETSDDELNTNVELTSGTDKESTNEKLVEQNETNVKVTKTQSNESGDEEELKNKENHASNGQLKNGTDESSLKPPQESNDFKKGVRVDVLCKSNYFLSYFWGVNIDQFHNFMRLNCSSFNDRLFDGSLFDQAYLEKTEPRLINGSEQLKSFKLACTERVNPETLGQSPRTCYPLVVILSRDLIGEESNQDENDVVFMINVLHVKDPVCPLETNVITRLLKKRNGLTINLQTLYTVEFDDEPGTGTTAICVICQENLVSIALLPCRHTCTCLDCFTKIDKCPLCRSYIRSYFILKFEEETNAEQQNNSNSESTNQTPESNQADSRTAGDTLTNEQTVSQSTNFFKKVGYKFTNLFRGQHSHSS